MIPGWQEAIYQSILKAGAAEVASFLDRVRLLV